VEIQRRIEGLQREMISLGVHGVLIAQRVDLLYFSGCAQNAYLYAPQEGQPLLLVRKHASRAGRDSPLPLQAGLASVMEIPERLAEHGLSPPRVLGMAWDALPVREFELFRKLLPSRTHVDVSDAIHRLRAVKTAWEIERVATAARVCEETLDHLRAHVRPGMSEPHLAGLCEAFARCLGHGGGIRVRHPSEDDRSGWISREEGVVPPGRAFACGFRAVVNGYHAARCRVLGGGKGSDRDRRVEALENAHRKALSRAATGTSLGDLEEAARSVGFEWRLHGIGLELREPLVTPALRPDPGQGLCLVLETRLEKSSDLRLQDTLVVCEKGVRRVREPP
jgi:Xaa-Pro aminopeptidase